MLTIPFKDFSSFSETVILGDVSLNLKFRWNGRDNSWFMDVRDFEDNPILLGLKILINWEMIFRFTNTSLPDGKILAVSSIGSDSKIQKDDLINSVKLVYIGNDEII